MNIKHEGNVFYIGDNVEYTKAEMTYKDTDEDIIIIDHTLVSKELEGQGIGKKLLEEVVKYARENNLKVMATCSYAEYQLEKNPEYKDIYLKEYK